MENSVYIENTDKKRNQQYSHQKRPDIDRRMKNVMPYDRIVKKKSNSFTTEVKSKQTKFKSKNEN